MNELNRRNAIGAAFAAGIAGAPFNLKAETPKPRMSAEDRSQMLGLFVDVKEKYGKLESLLTQYYGNLPAQYENLLARVDALEAKYFRREEMMQRCKSKGVSAVDVLRDFESRPEDAAAQSYIPTLRQLIDEGW